MAELIERLAELRDFLAGSRAMDGTWFGEAKMVTRTRPGMFWWRATMRERLDEAATTLATMQAREAELVAENVRLRGDVSRYKTLADDHFRNAETLAKRVALAEIERDELRRQVARHSNQERVR